MDLQNTLPHKRNTAVNVDGTEYKIDEQGVCRGVSDVHAQLMLQNKEAWRPFIVRKPAAPGEPRADRPRLQPILADGTVLTPAPPLSPEEEEAAKAVELDEATKAALENKALPTESLESSASDEAEEEKKPKKRKK